YSIPNGVAFGEALSKLPMSVSLASVMDETASLCTYVMPDHHALESWNDYSPKASEFGIQQPTIRPLFDTTCAQESFLVWAGKAKREGKDSTVYYNYIKENWENSGIIDGMDWDKAIHNSAHSKPIASPTEPEFNDAAIAG